jgi:hypothetical protein
MRSLLAAVPCKGRLLARGKRLYGVWGGVDGPGHGATLSIGRLGRGIGARRRAPCPLAFDRHRQDATRFVARFRIGRRAA